MLALILICVVCFLVLFWHSRLVGISLGLPVAYLFSLLFQHLPGAFAHWVGRDVFLDSSATQIGLRLTAIGVVCFVVGVVVAQRVLGAGGRKTDTRWWQQGGIIRFAVYCLFGGWLMVCAAALLGRIPSLGAAIDQAAAVWILGVMIGFLNSVQQRRFGHICLWLAALSVYPLLVLIRGGFLSFGSTSIFVVFSALLVMVRRPVLAYLGWVLFAGFCFLTFLSYFQNRNDIRGAVWGGADLEQRVARATAIITSLAWFDAGNVRQLHALDERLNQNQFAGMAAQRIEAGEADFLRGSSVWEGLQAMVPRMFWEDKPIFAGSSQLIRELSGFEVNEDTSYGVGQVMEFYVNFGMPSLVVGFLVLGFAYGWVDRKAAVGLQGGNLGGAILWFLLGVAMLAPLASVAEVMGNVAAAVVAGYGWRYAWGLLGAKMLPKQFKTTRLAAVAKRTGQRCPTKSETGR